MIASLLALFATLKPILVPLFTFLAGWLFPSPIQRAAKSQGDTNAAERKATETRGNMSDLDNLS